MKFKWHFIGALIAFTVLWILILEITIIAIIFGIIISVFVPDSDFKINAHRHYLFHSIIVWVIILIFEPHIICLCALQGVGIHCALDTKFKRSGMKGTYCISFWGQKKLLNGIQSTIWLWCNVIATIGITIWWLLN